MKYFEFGQESEFIKNIYLFFFTGIFYVLMGKAGPKRKKFLAKITGRTLEEAECLRMWGTVDLPENIRNYFCRK